MVKRKITESNFEVLVASLQKSIDIVERISKFGTMSQKARVTSILRDKSIYNWKCL